MKILTSFIFLLWSINLFAIPLKYDFKKIKKKGLEIVKVEVIPSKVTQKTVVKKSMHGKPIFRKISVPKMDTSDKNKIEATAYFKGLAEKLVLKMGKIKGPIVVKIQIQESGIFDTLQVKHKNSKTLSKIESILYQENKLPKIPSVLDLSEIQLIFHFK